MSWMIVGTVPMENFPLSEGCCSLEQGGLSLDGSKIKVARGTPALLGAACAAAEVLGISGPRAILAGDIGRGQGSRMAYERMLQKAADSEIRLVTFHYLQPDVVYHNKILWALEERHDKPLLIADAGYMYVAKMSGFAGSYDLFTPDVGEMAFLADGRAPHPFYTRGFLLQEEERVPELITIAYAEENAARHLLVKGRTDYIVAHGRILATISEPSVEAMEPIGGTGDTLTGLVTALLASGLSPVEACCLAARANRLLGFLARPTPAFSVADLLPFLPSALEQALTEFSRDGYGDKLVLA
jgi:ADP-dependent NAD(P)H-hydrate dehydratase / NAD(P)H-hydrate epimerase